MTGLTLGPAVRCRRLAGILAGLLAAAGPAGAEPARPAQGPPVAGDGRDVGRGSGPGGGDGTFAPPATGATRLESARPPYPAAVQRPIEESRRACLRAGGTGLATGSGFVRTRDLTGDGRADIVVDFRRARCVGAPSPFEGTGGWRLVILVVRRGGSPVRVFSDQVLDYDIAEDLRAPVVRFRLHGGRCGGLGPDPCLRQRRLDAHPFTLDGS